MLQLCLPQPTNLEVPGVGDRVGVSTCGAKHPVFVRNDTNIAQTMYVSYYRSFACNHMYTYVCTMISLVCISITYTYV